MAGKYYTVDNLERSSSVGFLVKRCGALMSQVAERRFEATAVSFTQWQVLIWLSTQESQISATQLSAEMGHDMGALTRVVDELERRHLVRRERSRRDRRAVEIAITAAGRRQADSAKRTIVELLNELIEPFSAAETATLIKLLNRMLARLEEAAERAPAAPAAPSARGRSRREAGRKANSGVAA
jgi:DNA-binding MarR family transcriptional regulator